MEILKRHLPFSGQEGLQELKKIAVRFEEKVYTAATSQSDYLRKISLKMPQNTIPTGNGNKPLYPGGSVQNPSFEFLNILTFCFIFRIVIRPFYILLLHFAMYILIPVLLHYVNKLVPSLVFC
ncbi:hypothetical protein BDE02_03G021300 [Populus trichocarpa]|nr:hypothetical protein BDE02_03G021300 [Populus trichocarpa]